MLTFRPHHFLCTLGFVGKGYSPKFVENYQKIVDLLKSESETPIQVVSRTDSVCSACPSKRGAKCETQEKIDPLDQAHAEALGLIPGSVLTWTEAQRKIKEKISLTKFHQICSSCSWKSLGVCESALRNLIEKST